MHAFLVTLVYTCIHAAAAAAENRDNVIQRNIVDEWSGNRTTENKKQFAWKPISFRLFHFFSLACRWFALFQSFVRFNRVCRSIWCKHIPIQKLVEEKFFHIVLHSRKKANHFHLLHFSIVLCCTPIFFLASLFRQSSEIPEKLRPTPTKGTRKYERERKRKRCDETNTSNSSGTNWNSETESVRVWNERVYYIWASKAKIYYSIHSLCIMNKLY